MSMDPKMALALVWLRAAELCFALENGRFGHTNLDGLSMLAMGARLIKRGSDSREAFLAVCGDLWDNDPKDWPEEAIH